MFPTHVSHPSWPPAPPVPEPLLDPELSRLPVAEQAKAKAMTEPRKGSGQNVRMTR
jgi:hypothetical protein